MDREYHSKKKIRDESQAEKVSQKQVKNMYMDYVILAKREQDSASKPIFVLEAKRMDVSLEDHLPQLYSYLRRLCLENRYPHLCGVLTNYKSWIFVKFDLMAEVEAVSEAVKNENVSPDQIPAHFEKCQ